MADLTENINIKRTIHHIYCDKCDTFIKDVIEYDDGYYDINDCDMNWSYLALHSNIFKFKEFKFKYKILCDKCKDEIYKDIIDKINKMGYFKSDNL